ncbi:hypothetical protein F4604DRAFT_1572319, partial [Suillus subluteus]
LYKSINITHPITGKHTSTLILAHVKYIHVRKDMLTQRGVIDLTKFNVQACRTCGQYPESYACCRDSRFSRRISLILCIS